MSCIGRDAYTKYHADHMHSISPHNHINSYFPNTVNTYTIDLV